MATLPTFTPQVPISPYDTYQTALQNPGEGMPMRRSVMGMFGKLRPTDAGIDAAQAKLVKQREAGLSNRAQQLQKVETEFTNSDNTKFDTAIKRLEDLRKGTKKGVADAAAKKKEQVKSGAARAKEIETTAKHAKSGTPGARIKAGGKTALVAGALSLAGKAIWDEMQGTNVDGRGSYLPIGSRTTDAQGNFVSEEEAARRAGLNDEMASEQEAESASYKEKFYAVMEAAATGAGPETLTAEQLEVIDGMQQDAKANPDDYGPDIIAGLDRLQAGAWQADGPGPRRRPETVDEWEEYRAEQAAKIGALKEAGIGGAEPTREAPAAPLNAPLEATPTAMVASELPDEDRDPVEIILEEDALAVQSGEVDPMTEEEVQEAVKSLPQFAQDELSKDKLNALGRVSKDVFESVILPGFDAVKDASPEDVKLFMADTFDVIAGAYLGQKIMPTPLSKFVGGLGGALGLSPVIEEGLTQAGAQVGLSENAVKSVTAGAGTAATAVTGYKGAQAGLGQLAKVAAVPAWLASVPAAAAILAFTPSGSGAEPLRVPMADGTTINLGDEDARALQADPAALEIVAEGTPEAMERALAVAHEQLNVDGFGLDPNLVESLNGSGYMGEFNLAVEEGDRAGAREILEAARHLNSVPMAEGTGPAQPPALSAGMHGMPLPQADAGIASIQPPEMTVSSQGGVLPGIDDTTPWKEGDVMASNELPPEGGLISSAAASTIPLTEEEQEAQDAVDKATQDTAALADELSIGSAPLDESPRPRARPEGRGIGGTPPVTDAGYSPGLSAALEPLPDTSGPNPQTAKTSKVENTQQEVAVTTAKKAGIMEHMKTPRGIDQLADALAGIGAGIRADKSGTGMGAFAAAAGGLNAGLTANLDAEQAGIDELADEERDFARQVALVRAKEEAKAGVKGPFDAVAELWGTSGANVEVKARRMLQNLSDRTASRPVRDEVTQMVKDNGIGTTFEDIYSPDIPEEVRQQVFESAVNTILQKAPTIDAFDRLINGIMSEAGT